MKRSEINLAITEALALLQRFSWTLPSFAHWTRAEYRAQPDRARWLHDHQLGWDVTDFGSGDFARTGLALFCLRNGRPDRPDGRSYAEKLLVVQEGQLTPTHRHFRKCEDIINRGGGRLVVEFTETDAQRQPTADGVTVICDGVERRLGSFEPLLLAPGDSVTIPPGLFHRFYGDKGAGPVLVGEVSSINDDLTDNDFLEPLGRFSQIEEDAEPIRLLWNEVPLP